MNLQQAYADLELPPNSTPEDAKKQFRKLSKKYHPDNQTTGDESTFKKINAAHQFITNPPKQQYADFNQQDFNPIHFAQNFNNIHYAEGVQFQTELSFSESILGCKKEIKYNRKIKCQDCNGNGHKNINNGCDKCHGSGQITGRQGNMMFIRTCDKCRGKTPTQPCTTCESQGILDSETDITINIPGGVSSSTILRLTGKGNFIGSFGPMDQYTDAYLSLSVKLDPDLTLKNNEIFSTLSISLLEAIRGTSKSVKTVLGSKTVDIKPLSKNKDEIIIPNVGVNGVGPQKVILDVDYPKDINILINALTESK